MKKVLIITYYWPPSGGAGVQRWLKFAKYLPEFGWQPVILTVDPHYASYPQRDESLLAEVDSNCLVYTTKSFELYNLYKWVSGKKEVPYGGFANESKEGLLQKASKFLRGNFLLPDPRKGWNKYALKKAAELIQEFNIDTVVTTSPPHSTQLIGLKLKQKFNIRWIADLRDPWTDIYYYNQFKHTALALKIDKSYERKVIENADRLVTVSEDVKRIFAEKSSLQIAAKTAVVPNGFDEEDFRITEVQAETRKIITYTGTISEAYDVDAFLDALVQMDTSLKSNLLIRFVGKVPSSVAQKFRNTGLEVELVGYVDHSKSIEYLFRSDLLLLVIPKVKNNQGILTGKFFEYLASQKTVLAIGPVDGDLARIMEETQCGKLFDYADADGMLRFAEEKLNAPFTPSGNVLAKSYSRKELTRKIAEILGA
ncbi:MAG: glycosyltransferase family 4 protein [Prolixibacteraceae bacterium]|nr:glycosyltransferase family 4 protein [Prolixibacteraceae bacterium]